jgi:hypothetical protein
VAGAILDVAGSGLAAVARAAPGFLMETARIGLNAAGAALTPVEYFLGRLAEPAVEQSNCRDMFNAARDLFRRSPEVDEDHDRAQGLFTPLHEVLTAITDDLNNEEHIATAQRFAAETRALLADGRAQEAEARIGFMRLVLDAMGRMG